MDADFFKNLGERLDIKELDVESYSPPALAYIGDAVYEVYVRTLILSGGNAPVRKLHTRSVGYVKAKAQSGILRKLMEELAPDELEVVRRGRNAKSGTIPKNVNLSEYKYATGFEALIGYLYLKKDYKRLLEILRLSVSGCDGGGG